MNSASDRVRVDNLMVYDPGTTYYAISPFLANCELYLSMHMI